MRGVRRTFLGAAIGLLALPAGATAQAVIDRDATSITFTSEADVPNTVGVSFIPGASPSVLFVRSDGAIAAGASALCTASACPWDDAVQRVGLVGAAAADSFDVRALRENGPPADAVPVVVDGGAGSDRVVGTPGPERFSGGPGDDRLDGLAGADDFAGGDGDDRVVLGATGAAVSLDGVANDGPDGTANVHADVERIEGGDGADTLTAGAGTQTLGGGGGADTLDPGPGADSVQGGPGADTIHVRDGDVDQVSCGGDAGDVVDADAADVLTGCPVDPSPPPPAGPGPAPAPGPAATAPPPPAAQPARVKATVSARWRVKRRFTVLTRLRVRGAPAGAKLAVRCDGRGCRGIRRRAKLVDGGASLSGRFAGRRLRPGTVVELRITAPGLIGRVERLVVRRRKDPRRTVLCLPPGGAKPQRC